MVLAALSGSTAGAFITAVLPRSIIPLPQPTIHPMALPRPAPVPGADDSGRRRGSIPTLTV